VKQKCEVQLEDEIQIVNSEEPAKGLTVYDSSTTNVEKFKHKTTTIYSERGSLFTSSVSEFAQSSNKSISEAVCSRTL
jgi:hypothetical protein